MESIFKARMVATSAGVTSMAALVQSKDFAMTNHI